MQSKKGFSMLELIFVIVVIGILSKFGVEFLAQAYRNFIFSNINNRLQAQSEAAVEFIAKRLEHRLKGSEVAREGLAEAATSIKNDTVSGETWTVLEWVGEDVDGLRGDTAAYWSGILDLDDLSTTNANLVSPGTNSNLLATNITNLGGTGLADAAISFVRGTQDITGYGWDGTGLVANNAGRSIHPIGANGSVLTGNFADVEVYEFYKLSWTAYGILHDENDNLWLYYNYQPWNGDIITTHNTRELIMENVSSFQFRPVDDLLKIQVCVHSDGIIDGDATTTVSGEYAICKEKTVF
ncbi:MAG: type II secretion system protein [Sulfurimonas sp.]|jgi:prepilin-type N-terminal cleavage/methylation domain-containing protein|nr:type II secretion system protein [Sulfurimonas sp.]